MTGYTDFYSTTATVIPVLFLVFSIQNREFFLKTFYEKQAPSDLLFGMAWIVGSLSCAEMAALAGLLGYEWAISLIIIIIAIGGSLIVLAYSFLNELTTDVVKSYKAHREWHTSKRWRFGVYSVTWMARIAILLPFILTVALMMATISKSLSRLSINHINDVQHRSGHAACPIGWSRPVLGGHSRTTGNSP
jgi:hypothetical protein